MLMSKGPMDWHSGQEPGFTSWFWDWKNGPRTKLHLLQLYLTMASCGSTPVQLVTTPLVRISWFRCSCLQVHRQGAFSWNQTCEWRGGQGLLLRNSTNWREIFLMLKLTCDIRGRWGDTTIKMNKLKFRIEKGEAGRIFIPITNQNRAGKRTYII